LAYAKSFGVDPADVTKDQRQVGKVQELAFGYQGAVGAWVTFATGFGIDLEEMADKAHASIPAQTLLDSTGMREWARQKKMPSYGLTDKTWIVCDAIKALWREAHSNTSAFWKDIEEQAIAAALDAGKTYYAGKRKFPIRRDGTWLRIRMPSGRYLCYPGVQVDDSGKLSYMGLNQYTRKWERLNTYGGKLTENLTQAMSRDVLAHSMPLIEAAGYQIVLTVHDEIIAETPDSPEFNVEHLAALMAKVPSWVDGLPLAAAGFETYRYRKD
jgi:DNA polymerase